MILFQPSDRKVDFKKIQITEVTQTLCFYGQMVDQQPKLEKLTEEMRAHFSATPPTPGSYKRELRQILSVYWIVSVIIHKGGCNRGYCCESEVLFSVIHFSHVSTL